MWAAAAVQSAEVAEVTCTTATHDHHRALQLRTGTPGRGRRRRFVTLPPSRTGSTPPHARGGNCALTSMRVPALKRGWPTDALRMMSLSTSAGSACRRTMAETNVPRDRPLPNPPLTNVSKGRVRERGSEITRQPHSIRRRPQTQMTSGVAGRLPHPLPLHQWRALQYLMLESLGGRLLA